MAGPVATNPPPADNSNQPPTNTDVVDKAIDDAQKGANGGGNPPPADDPPPNDKPDNPDGGKGGDDLYKGIDLNGGENKDGDGKGGNNQPPAQVSDEDYIKAAGFDGDEDVVVGKGADGKDLTFDKGEARAIAPILNKMGIGADKAKEIMGVFAHLDSARKAAWEKREAEALDGMAKEVREEFGADLDKTLRDMVKGARHVFPDTLWKQMQTVKPLIYNKDFIRAMAKVGRDYAQDDGTGGGSSGGAKSILENFTAEGWMKSSEKFR